MALLTFDVGTSAIKVALFSDGGELVRLSSSPLRTNVSGRRVTQDPLAWWKGFLRGAQECLAGFDGEKLAILGTGQMEDLLLLDEAGNPLEEASLYSDSDLEGYCPPEAWLRQLEAKTPNRLDSFTPFLKVMVRRRLPLWERVSHIILGAKDYLNFCLTGVSATDFTNAATSGFFDGANFRWVEEAEDLLPLLPCLSWPEMVIGTVKREILPLLGLAPHWEIPVYNGIGDLGAVTLGAGISALGEGYGYLGTTGWMAFLASSPSPNKDLFSLPFLQRDEWVVVAPILNLGNAYQWSMKTFLRSTSYAESEAVLARYLTTPVQVWPYLNGERAPMRNERVRVVMARLGEGTTSKELHAAFLRSLLFALRHAYEALQTDIPVIRLVGGLTRGEVFVQSLSDVLGRPCQVAGEEALAPQRGLERFFRTRVLGEVSLPSMAIEREYTPQKNPVLEEYYQEYRKFAEQLLRNETTLPAYL